MVIGTLEHWIIWNTRTFGTLDHLEQRTLEHWIGKWGNTRVSYKATTKSTTKAHANAVATIIHPNKQDCSIAIGHYMVSPQPLLLAGHLWSDSYNLRLLAITQEAYGQQVF